MLIPDLLIWQKINHLKTKSLNAKKIALDHLDFFIPDSSVQALLEKAIQDVDQILESGYILKNDGGTTASLVNLKGSTLFLKRTNHNAKKFYHKFKYLAFPSRGYLNWVASTIFLENGIITPRILGIGEYRRHGILEKSYLFAENMENVQQVDEIFGKKNLSRSECKELLSHLGQFVAHIHQCGIHHGDMKLTNLFFKNEELGTWDLDGIKLFDSGVPKKYALKDLGRVYSSFLMYIDSNPYLDNWVSSVKEGADIICQAYGVDSDQIMKDLSQYWFRKEKLSNFII